jgi:hypothetical protein
LTHQSSGLCQYVQGGRLARGVLTPCRLDDLWDVCLGEGAVEALQLLLLPFGRLLDVLGQLVLLLALLLLLLGRALFGSANGTATRGGGLFRLELGVLLSLFPFLLELFGALLLLLYALLVLAPRHRLAGAVGIGRVQQVLLNVGAHSGRGRRRGARLLAGDVVGAGVERHGGGGVVGCEHALSVGEGVGLWSQLACVQGGSVQVKRRAW